MSAYHLTYKYYGESAVLIEWPNEISEAILNDIRLFSEKIKKASPTGIIDFNFVYHSLLVTFNPTIVSGKELIIRLKEIYESESLSAAYKSSTWYIPVYYGNEFGVDFDAFLLQKNLSKSRFISLHTTPIYTVFGIGFLPGFLYLGGLDKKLHLARKETPSLKVSKGSVAIGGSQTGIYPQDSPGGWHVIGKSPISLFNGDNDVPTFISAGDKVKFYPVSKTEFEILKIEGEKGDL